MPLTFLAVSLLSLMLPQFPVMQPAAGDARIAGQIVDADSHAPIAGARVMLMPPPPLGHGAPAVSTALAPTYYPGTTDRQASQVVTLSSGETVSGLQFSMVSAPAFQVSGMVVDEAGTPIGNVMVLLVSELERDVSFAPIMGQAGQDGTFHIDGIVPGAYRIMAIPPMAASDPRPFGAVASRVTGGVAVGGGFFTAGDAASPFRPVQVIVEKTDVKDVRIVVPARR